MKKIFGTTLLLILTLIIVTLVFSYRMLKKSLPQTDSTVEVQTLKNNVQIYRDDYGIPHIFAKNDHDLYFAQGYAIAQDRLWQLDLVRRAVNGRLSEVFGDSTITVDKFLLTIGFKRIGARLHQLISETSKSVIQAYTDGINHFIETSEGNYPIEFMMLNSKPEYWHPEDCLAFSRFMAWELSFSWYVELLTSKINEKIGMVKTQELFGDYWPDWPIIISENLGKFDLQNIQQVAHQLAKVTGIKTWPQGSNNWVINGAKSKSGKPILANDPHLLLSNPSRWYMIHLHAPGINVAGFTLPGSPGVVIGFNQKISWGFTNVMADVADFFVKEINPDDSTRYWDIDSWRKMGEEEETILIKNSEPYRFKVQLTKHGPIINEIHPKAKHLNKKVTLKWTGQEMSDEVLSFYNLNRAGNWTEFKDAIQDFKVPNQNIVYGDVNGNIGYYCSGLIPIRTGTNRIYPKFNDDDWFTFIHFDELPRNYNPAKGYLATANNRVTSKDYPYYISHMWEPPSRILRIEEILDEDKDFSVDDFKTMQLDNFSPFAEYLISKVSQELDNLAAGDEKFNQIKQFIQGWDFHVRGESVAATIFQVFLQRFLENTFKDELGEEDFKDYATFASLPLRTVRKIYDNKLYHWFDDQRTKDKKETATDIILKSWKETLVELENRLGEDQITWRWDKIHQVTFKHFLGDQPMLNRIFNVGPLPMAGSHTTINNGNYSLAEPYNCIVGPSMRMIVDMANPGRAEVINPPGQVGHPLSQHYRDQADYWLKGLYITLETDSTIIKKSGFDLLELEAGSKN